MRARRRHCTAAGVFAVWIALVPPIAQADARVAERTYRQACGACHAPLAPKRLPAESWRQVLGRLGNHYGSAVKLDTEAEDQISVYLAWAAGKVPAPLGAEPRIACAFNSDRSPRDAGCGLPGTPGRPSRGAGRQSRFRRW